MAKASERLESTSERENYQRVDRLIVDGCTALLRDVFDSIIPPSTLATVLASNRVHLKRHAKLSRVQCDTLYPPSGRVVSSEDFDITLLFSLLRHICNLPVPPNGWDIMPEADDVTLEAELVRIKFYRNSVHGHVRDTKIIKADFQVLWKEIKAAMLGIARILKKEHEWKNAINNLAVAPLTTKDDSIQEIKATMGKGVSEIEGRIALLETFIQSKFNQHLFKLSSQVEASTIKENKPSGEVNSPPKDDQDFYQACREGRLHDVKVFTHTYGKHHKRAIWVGAHHAADYGHTNVTEFLLDSGGDMNFKDENGWNTLHHAARGGNGELVKLLLERRIKVDSKSSSNLTPLHIAAQNSKIDIVSVLMSRGADVTAVDDSGMNALHFASRGGHVPTIEKVLSRGKELLDSKTNDGVFPLMKAAADGHEDAVTYLLACGADPAAVSNDGSTVLHCASGCGHSRMLEKLLKLSIDINTSRTSDGITPFHNAAFNGKLDAVNVLIDHGADQTAVGKNSWNVLHFAALGGNTTTIERVLKLPIGINSRTSEGSTPLHITSVYGNVDAVNVLIDHGADQAAVDKDSWNVLHCAAYGGNTTTIERLLKLPIDINSRTSKGSTPLHITSVYGNVDAVNVLIDHGADQSAVNKNDWNVLHSAAQGGNTAILERLLKLPIDINSKTRKTCTPLHISSLYGNVDAVSVIIDHGADQTAVNKNNWNVLHFAARSGNAATIERLLKLPIDINSKTSKGATPLHVTSEYGNLDAVNVLIDQGADQTAVDKNSWNVLHRAARSGNTATLRRLLKLPIDIDSRTNEGITPLHIAAANGQLEALNLLLACNANLHAVSFRGGWNILHFASKGNNTKIIERVLFLGLDINSKTNSGSTALDIALWEEKDAAVQYLSTGAIKQDSRLDYNTAEQD